MNPSARTFALSIRVIATLVVAGVIVAVAMRSAAPSGVLRAETDFLSPAPLLSILKPADRVEGPDHKDGSGVALIASPAYIDLAAPDAFDRVTVSLRFADTGQQVMEFGALGSLLDNTFLMRPMRHPLLDTLAWPKVSDGAMTLFQRTPTYASVAAFLKNPPAARSVALYHADADLSYQLPEDASSAAAGTNVSLRGSHRLLTTSSGETLQLTFSVQDMNRQEGADPVMVSVYRLGGGERALAQTVLSDDGNVSDDQRSVGLRTISVSLTDPEPGAYRVALTTSDDVFIRAVRTPQQKLVFEGRVYLGDHIGFSDATPPATVFADGVRITARTAHDESVQTILADGRPLPVAAARTTYSAALSETRAPHALVSPKRDIVLQTDGVFAFSESHYFDPLPFSLGWYTDAAALDRLGVDYILTTYQPPVQDGDTLVATAEFDIAELATTDLGAYRFAISAPGLGETGAMLRLEGLRATLHRAPSTLRDAFQRLFAGLDRPAPNVGADTIVPSGTSFDEVIP